VIVLPSQSTSHPRTLAATAAAGAGGAISAMRVALRRSHGRRAVHHPVRLVLALVALFVVVGAGWLWLRDSSLVAVRDVEVTGTSSPDSRLIRAAVEAAALDMTTLHIREDRLAAAVARFPIVRGVEVERDLPHRLRVHVLERTPVALLATPAGRIAVAGDGTLLQGARVDPDLAVIQAKGERVTGKRLGDGALARAVAVMAAAPPALRARVTAVRPSPRGLALPLRDGPVLYFGGANRLAAKWAAAARVLASAAAAGATYLDLRLPERVAAGGLEDPNTPAEGATTDPAAGAAAGAVQPAAGAAPPATQTGTATPPAGQILNPQP
jgi:cell division protein FtsQ